MGRFDPFLAGEVPLELTFSEHAAEVRDVRYLALNSLEYYNSTRGKSKRVVLVASRQQRVLFALRDE
jgi:hypothetical protein